MKIFLDKTITIRRLKAKSGYRTAYSATGTAWEASVQEPNPEMIELFGGKIGQVYEVFLDASCDVREADQIVYNNEKYSVKDVKEVSTSWGFVSYKRLIVVKQE